MTRKLNYKIPMCILPVILHVTVGKEMAARYMARHGLDIVEGLLEYISSPSINGTYYTDGHGMHLICLPDEYDASVIHHEALHAATSMWHEIGSNLHFHDNDEVLEYTMNHIADRIEEICYAD